MSKRTVTFLTDGDRMRKECRSGTSSDNGRRILLPPRGLARVGSLINALGRAAAVRHPGHELVAFKWWHWHRSGAVS
ncbi:hypothetical protein BJQ90_03593 [Arthrobacter sp. SO3]|nr:hypothetical protein [Arthrobacter sp. SO3]